MNKIAIIGAGFSGSTIANILAKNGFNIDVFESRAHVAGNCYTERDSQTNILVHKYGPHIFHTNDNEVWHFVNTFSNFKPFVNRVKTTVSGNVYSLPINLHTINQYFNKCFNPSEAISYIKALADKSIKEPQNFEEQALKFVGKDLYESFFKGYTQKQWGCEPRNLPASILKRLPLRFNYDDNYFNHIYQGIPENGYTVIIDNLLDHKNINISLNHMAEKNDLKGYDHVFYSGPIDKWFDYHLGMLGYRTLNFEEEVHDGDYQGCAVMNYPDKNIPYTRISEHKHFSPWETHDKTIIYKEFSMDFKIGDIPYYPIRLVEEKVLLQQYIDLASKEDGVSFIGRLGTYRYLDMDVTIREAIDVAKSFLKFNKDSKKIPVFFNNPL